MKIETASYQILDFPDDAINRIAQSARVCYQSEPAGDESGFVKRILERGHFTPFEHVSITVKIVCDRGVMAELTRHRLCSFNIESTRYANYSKAKFGGELTFIKPCFWDDDSVEYGLWAMAMESAEDTYMALINAGANPEQARSVLPNSLKTEIIMTCNSRELLHIFDLRCSDKAHPQIRELMIPLRDEMRRRCPVIFGEVA